MGRVRPSTRATYGGGFVKSVSWATNSAEYNKAMSRLHIETNGFMLAMAKSSASFNPFKDWRTKMQPTV